MVGHDEEVIVKILTIISFLFICVTSTVYAQESSFGDYWNTIKDDDKNNILIGLKYGYQAGCITFNAGPDKAKCVDSTNEIDIFEIKRRIDGFYADKKYRCTDIGLIYFFAVTKKTGDGAPAFPCKGKK